MKMCVKINKKLLPLKAFYFLYYAGVGSLIPFIPIHLKGVGLTASETGVIFGLLPFVTFVTSPVIGGLIDKYNIHKPAFIVSVLLAGFSSLALKWTPEVNIETLGKHNSTGLLKNECMVSQVTLDLCEMINDTPTNLSENNLLNPIFLVCHIPKVSITDTKETQNVTLLQSETFVLPASTNLSVVSKMTCIQQTNNLTLLQTDDESSCNYFSHYSCQYHKNITVFKERLSLTTGFQAPFWIALFILSAARTIHCSVMMFTDAVAFNYLGEKRSRFGQQRMFGSIGFVLLTIPVSVFLHFFSNKDGHTDFSLAFYAYAGFSCAAAFNSAFMRINFTQKKQNCIQASMLLLKEKEMVILLFVTVFICGMLGCIEGFLFWYMKQLGSSQLLIGLSSGAAVISEIVLFFMSSKCVKRFGEIRSLQLSLLAVTIRFLNYSFISNPWYALPGQFLHGFTFSLMWVSASAFVSKKAPKGLAVTTQSILGSLSYGVGYGTGNLVTGVAFDKVGGAWTFRINAILTALVLVLLLCLDKLWLNSKSNVQYDAPQNNSEDQEMIDASLLEPGVRGEKKS